MKVVAVVPMKLNNSRLPGKNTKAFTNGSPLCTYILKTLLNVKLIDEIYVYCSNPAILKYLPKNDWLAKFIFSVICLMFSVELFSSTLSSSTT